MSARPEPHELDPVAMANRRAKGKRPQFLDDPAVERVMSIAMAVAGELAVARERLDTLERLLVAKGVLGADDIERYVPSAEVQAARNEQGRAYVARVLRMLDQDVQAMQAEPEPSMDEVAADLGRAEPGP
jgi:polyhydroxyalkanoate synthesis regulator phasin